MKVLKYTISVCDGAIGHIHDFYYDIVEIYVPELSLCVNGEASFISDDNRIPKDTNIEEIEIDVATSGVLTELANAKKKLLQCEDVVRKYFELEAHGN